MRAQGQGLPGGQLPGQQDGGHAGDFGAVVVIGRNVPCAATGLALCVGTRHTHHHATQRRAQKVQRAARVVHQPGQLFRVGQYAPAAQRCQGGKGSLRQADLQGRAEGDAVAGFYQPTFLYESLWDIGVALVVIWLDRRKHYTSGRAFALYVMLYTVGRGWIEALRIDDAHRFLGLRLNDWVSMLVFAAAAAYFVIAGRRTKPEEHLDEPLTLTP